MNLRGWWRRRQRKLDEEILLPAIERAADARGLTGPERKAAIAAAWELHQQMEERRTLRRQRIARHEIVEGHVAHDVATDRRRQLVTDRRDRRTVRRRALLR